MRNLFFVICALALTGFAVSCQSEEETTRSKDEAAVEFINTYNSTAEDVLGIGVRPGDKSKSPRKAIPTKADSMQTVYVKPSTGTGNAGSLQPFTGTTINEFTDYLSWADATVSIFNDGTAVDSVAISVNEAKQKLAPMVAKSRAYLLRNGMTNADIDEMLREKNVDETELVPLVLAMMEYDGSLYTGMAPFCAPKTGGKDYNQSSKPDWKKIGNCALEALGFNIGTQIITSACNSWSKAVIMKAFKTIAKKSCGPVGVVLTVGAFANCMGWIHISLFD